MRRDSIFYRLFAQSPILLFELLESPPINARDYRFDSVAVKEPKFEIDGVFLPPESDPPGTVFFAEVQFQRDEKLYERMFGEAFLYFYRNRDRFSDWQAVIVYPSRSTEQTASHPYRALLNSDQVHRIYLNELGEFRQLPPGVALMVLTTLTQNQAPSEARYLLAQSQQEGWESEESSFIMNMVITIMSYKFGSLSREEVEAMLDITFQETRVYRELREEVTEGARTEEAMKLVLRQLTRRLKQELSEETRSQITALSLLQLEELGEALVDFEQLNDLATWLEQRSV
ncbi:Rpn family recombination-promoting nuclease/putative transposase [Myxacorys almedinensis]|uniref:Rpn family recombination-promoting nuclease/putative transposase n=1 Tax=Myxacorys almedinensis A TaxID=2690445 RepID=A0A8J7Z5K3_9CYAN|nr:Rpn family recombination-promoting nuclease/putative transposase [Myxacorys almedinensis]NDJ18571.1 Rpn family recombination-promoting nuclease/putative transposase [Myxacorys almedinensis A]